MVKQSLVGRFTRGSLLVLCLLLAAAAEPVITLTITPTQQFAPGTITLKMRVPRDHQNFQLCFGFESDYITRSSCMLWDGSNAPLVQWQEYRNLPAGQYEAFAQLWRVPNRLAGQAKAQFNVLESSPQ